MANPVENRVKHIRLSDLNQKITTAIHSSFNNISFWVVADVTDHKFREEKSYHNFALVEKDPQSNSILAKIPGKAWGDGSLRIETFERQTGQKFTNNINVLVNVSVEFHPVYGLQVNLNDIDPTFTLGVLEQQRQATLEALVTNNSFINKFGDRYLTFNNQLKLGIVIQNVAVISSKTSAGSEDFLHTLENNPYGYKFIVDNYYTVVQGENNADTFFKKIIEVFESKKKYDVVVITRGGGAQTDFLIFDNYNIGRAIAKFPIPIITGIGHQKNETIADLMAHTQTKTPTKAAEFIIAHNRSFEEAMIDLKQRIIIKTQQMLSRAKEDLNDIRQDTIDTARTIVFRHQQSVSSRADGIRIFVQQFFRNKRTQLEHQAAILRVMKPDSILKRGFAIIKSGGKVVSNADGIDKGSQVDIILSDSTINATVNQKSKHDGSEFNL